MVKEAVTIAKKYGTIVSYDLNYRPSLWKNIGGQKKACQVNRALAPFIDVMIGNEEDFTACLGLKVDGLDDDISKIDPKNFKKMIKNDLSGTEEFPGTPHSFLNRTRVIVHK